MSSSGAAAYNRRAVFQALSRRRWHTLALVFAVALAVVAAGTAPDGDWRAWGRDPGGARFSPLAEIDRGNVGRLRRAWTYHTGDIEPASERRPAAFEAT